MLYIWKFQTNTHMHVSCNLIDWNLWWLQLLFSTKTTTKKKDKIYIVYWYNYASINIECKDMHECVLKSDWLIFYRFYLSYFSINFFGIKDFGIYCKALQGYICEKSIKYAQARVLKSDRLRLFIVFLLVNERRWNSEYM